MKYRAFLISSFIFLISHFSLLICPVGAQKYTDEHPLVIVCDWDFRPFEFVNDEGQPAGYNVDVLNMILDELDIPHKIVMQEWHEATNMFKHHQADLIHALYFFFKEQPYVATQQYINYYNLMVARRTDTTPLHRLRDLQPDDTLLIKEDDYAAMAIANMASLPFATSFHTPKEGLAGIRQGKYKYYAWGELPLNSKIQELGLDSITLDKIDIPAGELRIIGYDKHLVDMIDDQYTRLEQAGKLEKVHDRWFRPEQQHNDASPVTLFILGGLLLTAIIVLLLIYLIRRRVAITMRESSDLGKMMDQVLNMGDYFVIEWDFKSNMLRNKYGNLLPDGGMVPQEFLNRTPPEQSQQIHNLNAQLATGVSSHYDMSFVFNHGTQEQPVWRNYYGNAIVEMEESSNRPQCILYTIKDCTEEVNEERRIKTDASKYKKMFDANLIAMAFYDADGHLIDLNNKMREFTSHPSTLTSHPSLEAFAVDTYYPGSREIIHVCQHLEEQYIEIRIRPIIDDHDQLVYYILTCRDVTAERNMYLQQRHHDQHLQTLNKDIKRYELQLGYLLEESKMYIWNYIPDKNAVNMTRTPGQTEFTETIEEYLQSINASARQQAMPEIQRAMQQGKPYHTILPFDNTPLDQEPTWYAVTGIPLFNKDGQLTQYFGLSRNVTELMQAQDKLRVETARAQDSGRLKAAFLANMTHEIRTPLNAIVGFTDLLPTINDAAEKKEFMRIIRNNCDMLLRLISDILEASDIDSRPMDIEPTDIDFSQAFDDICQTLEQRVQMPGVKFIKENPYTTFPTRLDKGRIQQVITNFVINAVKYTQQGHIRVGYKASPDPSLTPNPSLKGEGNLGGECLAGSSEGAGETGLFIYCEDTGAGIPQEKQSSVFERFVKLNEFIQGTGLGLNICKSIAERCGGRIGVVSNGEGQGSTFWIWVPCPHDV